MAETQWYHFVGIKGVGMSALAIIARQLGYKVTGSDVAETFITDSALTDAGITPLEGFDADHVSPEIDLVVVGASFDERNPEVAAAQSLGLSITSDAKLRGEILPHKQTIAVCGTHGKTTTASLTARALFDNARHPSWLIGTGHIDGLPANGGAGEGEYFVVEGDEYKSAPDDPTPKFLYLNPAIAIITSVEQDHPELYPTLDAYAAAFDQFVAESDGLLIVNGDDERIRRLMEKHTTKQWQTYGFNDDVDCLIVPMADWRFSLKIDGENHGPFSTKLPGRHNQANAAASYLAARAAGLTDSEIAHTFETFTAVERRFQIIGQRGDQVIIDDYAHHPTAIKTTLAAARTQYPDRPIWCVFQSHTYSRTKALLSEFATAFADADQVIVTDIFASAREKDATINAEDLTRAIAAHHSNCAFVPFDDVASWLASHAPANAVILTIGAGNVYKIGQKFLG